MNIIIKITEARIKLNDFSVFTLLQSIDPYQTETSIPSVEQ